MEDHKEYYVECLEQDYDLIVVEYEVISVTPGTVTFVDEDDYDHFYLLA